MNTTLLLIIGGAAVGLWLLWNTLWIAVGLGMQRRQRREIERIAAQTGRTPEQVRLNWSGQLLGETDAQYHQRVVEAGAVAREQMTDEEIAAVEGLGNAVFCAVYGFTDDDLAAGENVRNWHTLTEEQRQAHFDRFVLPKLGEPEDAAPESAISRDSTPATSLRLAASLSQGQAESDNDTGCDHYARNYPIPRDEITNSDITGFEVFDVPWLRIWEGPAGARYHPRRCECGQGLLIGPTETGWVVWTGGEVTLEDVA